MQRLSFDDRRLVRAAQVGRVISAVPYQSSTQIAQLSTTLEDVQTLELDTRDVIAEALAIIDKNLGVLVQRELVSSSEMTDLLLDVRSLLAERSSN